MTTSKIEDIIADYIELQLDDHNFETVLETYDLTPTEVFIHLFNSGLIDEEVFEADRIVR